jgi:hypothetical protein
MRALGQARRVAQPDVGGDGGVLERDQLAELAAAHLPAPEVHISELDQLQPFLAVFPQECTGQLAYFGPA